jgi:hypothetical protein
LRFYLATRLAKAIDHKSLPETEHFVSITGLVHHQTSLGVFLEVARRRVFIPINCMSSPSAVFEPGEPAVQLVLRRFAEEEVTPLAESLGPQSRIRERTRSTIKASEKKTAHTAKPASHFHVLKDRLVSMCVVETTAATQSGMSSWKTGPCRLVLRLLTKPIVQKRN